jgi:predicted MFS family arabinose efflux permease
MLLLAAANVLAATATSYPVVVTARALVGVVIGGFWSIGAGLATRWSTRRDRRYS